MTSQVDFHSLARVTKILMRGGLDTNCYVTSYHVLYSDDPRWWKVYSNSNTSLEVSVCQSTNQPINLSINQSVNHKKSINILTS